MFGLSQRGNMHSVIWQARKKKTGVIASMGQVTFRLEWVKMEVWWFV